MKYKTNDSGIGLRVIFTVFLAALIAFEITGAVKASDEDYLGREMNMDFSFSKNFWNVTSPQPGDYFWVFSQMSFDLYATNQECSIDTFMVLERDKKGSVAAYTKSEKNFLDEMNVTSSMGFESWGGRIVGFVTSQGPGQKVGMMRSRQSTAGDKVFKNVIYSIVNNGNLVTFVISAPAESWSSSRCSGGINSLLGSFVLHGDPDPREQGIANYYERSTGINPSMAPVSASHASSSPSGSSALSESEKAQLKSLVGKAIEQAEKGEIPMDSLYDLEDLIFKIAGD